MKEWENRELEDSVYKPLARMRVELENSLPLLPLAEEFATCEGCDAPCCRE